MTDITNQDFLATLFDGLRNDEVCWTCAFPEPPDSNPNWKGRKTYLDDVQETPFANAYISVAAFKQGARGRKKDWFSRLFAVVLDDVDGVPLEPTWRLQTSANSYQAGYLLDNPIDDFELAKRLTDAIAHAGLAKADSSGNNTVRYVRLPVGYNNKLDYGKTFQCQLVTWRPELRYSIDQLCDSLGLTLERQQKVTSASCTPRRPESEYLEMQDKIRSGEDYHTPVARIAARRLANGLSERATVEELQALMNASTGERDSRWQCRYDDIPRAVRTALKFKPDPDDPVAMQAFFDLLEQGSPEVGWHVVPFNTESVPDLSHDQLALDLSKAGFGKDARYVAQWTKWCFWDGSRWAKDERLTHVTATRDFLRAKAQKLLEWADKKAAAIVAAEEDDADKTVKAILQFAKDNAKMLRQSSCVTAVESLARSNADLTATPTQFDADPMLLGTPAGTVDLATGMTRPPERLDYITRQCAVVPAPEGSPCPTWDKFLHRVMDGDLEMVAFLQRIVGYALTGHTSEHKLFFLFGTGRNGKSVFVNTIFGLFGDYAKRAPSQTFLESHGDRHPTDLAGLQGARLVAGSELPAGKAWNESIIKDLTGGDIITARFMRGDFFDYKPQFTLFIAGNHQPAIKTTDEAMRARIVMIPFAVTIPEHERDPRLEHKLRLEWPAILRWAIDGTVAWARDGLQVPASVRQASQEYLDAEDTIGEFIQEHLERRPGATVYASEIYRVFADWQRDAGIATPWSQKAMSQALTERGYKSEKLTGGTRGYRNLNLTVPATATQYRYRKEA